MRLKVFTFFFIVLFCSRIVTAQDSNNQLVTVTPVTNKIIEDFCSTSGVFSNEIDTLLSYKEILEWSDWVFYKSVKHFSKNLFPEKDENYQTIFTWYVLNKAGFDALIMLGEGFQIAVQTEELSTQRGFEFNNKRYVYLESISNVSKLKRAIVQCGYSGVNSFSFVIKTAPKFPLANLSGYELIFYDSVISNEIEVVSLCANDEYLAMLESYPSISPQILASTPISSDAHFCLINSLGKQVDGYDSPTKIRFLFHFVKAAILDMDYFKDIDSATYRKCLTPEETLSFVVANNISKVVLLIYLIKNLVNEDVAIMLFYISESKTHIGISLDQYGIKGDFLVDGTSYFICDVSDFNSGFGVGYKKSSKPYLKTIRM